MQRVTYETLFASWLSPGKAALLFAATFVLFWAALLWIFHRRRVYLRV